MSVAPDTTMEDESESKELVAKVARSCDVCKSRKVKCDGLKPKCSNCLKSKKKCNYSLMKKPGLKEGYGRSMSEKFLRLESSNAEIKELFKNLSYRVEELENEFSSTKRKKLNPVVQLSSSTGDTTNSEVSPAIMFPPLPTQSNQQQTQAQNQARASVHSSSSSSTQHQALALPSLLNPFVDASSDRWHDNGLPSQKIMERLYSLYFEYINPIFPILHPQTTHQQLFESSEPTYIAYGLMLISLKYLESDASFTDEDKHKFYKSMKEKILLNCFDVSNLDKLATMALLAFESMGQSNDQETWSLVAIVCSGAIHLDLVNEVPSQVGVETPGSVNSTSSNPVKSISTKSLKLLGKPKNFVEEENRRRVFWCIYILDRVNGVISSTPLKIPDHEITCSYPLDTQKWIQNEKLAVLDSFGCSIQLIKIFGNTHEFNKISIDINNPDDCRMWLKSFQKIEIDLKYFVDSLPLRYSSLLINNDVSNLASVSYYDILLHTIYNITLIKLHSPLGYPHNESDFFKHSTASRAVCSNCCTNVLNMISKVGDPNILTKLGPIYAIFLWIVTRVIIVEQILGQDDFDITINENWRAKSKLDKLLKILDNMSDHWIIAKKYCKIIRFLSNSRIKLNDKVKKEDDAAEEGADEAANTREPSSIISDMRLNTYFVSLMLTNQMERKEEERRKSEFTGTDMTSSAFQLDLNSYGFEDFFKYLGDINEVV